MVRPTMKPVAGKAFVTRSSKIAGRGAFATRPIRKGERLIEYLGERISHAEADSRYDDASMSDHHTFLFTVSRQTVIDARVGGNEARFINHSCDPNCQAVIDGSRVFIEASRSIALGEELAYDYGYLRDGTETADDEFRVYGCRCGSARCRGTILAPLPKAELAKRAAAATRRHHPPHVHTRTGRSA